jgi:16S rRNA processing protein RimM
VAVGKVVRPWGLRGDVKVESLTDFPDRFEPGETLWLDGVEREIEAVRWQKAALYLKLAGIDGTDEAEAWRDHLLEVPETDLHELEADEFYHHQLIGLRVHTEAGEELGTVREVLPTGSNAVLVVRGPRGEVLLPFIQDVVKRIDLAGGSLSVELLDGLLPEPVVPQRPKENRGTRRHRRTKPS